MVHFGLKHFWGCSVFVGFIGCASHVGGGQETVFPKEDAAALGNCASEPVSMGVSDTSEKPDVAVLEMPDALNETVGEPEDEHTPEVMPETVSYPVLDRQCFGALGTVTDERVVASSVSAVSFEDGRMLIAANDANGAAWVYDSDEKGAFHGEKVARAAQISCLERQGKEALIGITFRDALSGEYALQVWRIGYDGKKTGSPWKANAHGFSPDPGAKCALLGNRHLIVSGTRHRRNKSPLHGLFSIEKRDVTLIEGTSAHVPAIVKNYEGGAGVHEILVRQVESAEGKQIWPHLVYAIDETAEIQALAKNDFLFRHGQEWVGVTSDGCVVRGDSKVCSEISGGITAVDAVEAPDAGQIAMIWQTKRAAYLAVLREGMLQLATLPEKLKIYSVDRMGGWLASEADPDRPDIVRGLRFVQFDWACIKQPH